MDLSNRARILVLGAVPWDMTKDGGEKGVTVEYLMWGEAGEQLVAQSEWNPLKPVGVRRGKCSMEASFREKVVIAPAIYEAEFYLTIDGSGKNVQKLRDIAYVSNVEFKGYKVPGLVVPGMIVEQEPAPVEAGTAPKAEGKK